jgi:hypothetical protein
MKTNLITEFRIKALLQEVDWENQYSDVSKIELETKELINDLNDELTRQAHNRVVYDPSTDLKYPKDHIKRKLNKPLFGTGEEDKETGIRSGNFYDNNNKIDVDKFLKLITKRPDKIFKQNEKAKKTTGDGFQMTINTGIPALWGIIYDEQAERFVYVNTCPGAGTCIITCYALKSGYLRDNSVLLTTRTLNFLVNDPNGYKMTAIAELEGIMNDLGSESISLEVRWNDSGDFFSKTYYRIAKEVTKTLIEKGYDIKSYAYTKMGDLVTMYGDDGDFKLVFSTNANKQQLHQIDLTKERTSTMVPRPIFRQKIFEKSLNKKTGKKTAHFKKDEHEKYVWYDDNSKEELRKRIFEEYGERYALEYDKLIYQDELPLKIGEKNEYVVIMLPNESDTAPQRHDVRGIFILQH